ncbi:MAG: inosine/xanthosine triphosphatase [Candidatus Portnoybacteria bacterium]|nr:inosine/xanthosine triphosphatase [Candidatus Portnoybacteria bacterium]
MIINVGSTNKAKVEAVKEVIRYYDFLRDAKVRAVEVSSNVSHQPISIEETVKGATSRAKNAWETCDLSFGIESGLMKVPYTKTGYMDVCVCAIYDGKEYHLGLSSAFEYPKELTRLIFDEGINATQAAHKIGLTKNPRIGSGKGIIGILTKGRLTRKEYTKQAIITALIHLENAHLF